MWGINILHPHNKALRVGKGRHASSVSGLHEQDPLQLSINVGPTLSPSVSAPCLNFLDKQVKIELKSGPLVGFIIILTIIDVSQGQVSE